MYSNNQHYPVETILYETHGVKVYSSQGTVIKKLSLRKNPQIIHCMSDFLNHWNSISHKNLIKFKEVTVNNKSIIIVSKYIGPRANSFIDKTEPLRFLRNCIDGFCYLQVNEIAHNDVKIDNILRSDSGEYIIIDFDLMTYKNNNNETQTFLVGTPAYNSPEKKLMHQGQISQFNAYKSDVFSLGISFLTLLTKKFPINHEEIDEIISNLPLDYKIFSSILASMLCLDQENRPDFITLKKILYKEFQVIDSFSNINCRFCKTEEKILANIFLIQDKTVVCRKCFNKFIKVDYELECQNCYGFNVGEYRCSCQEYCVVCKSRRHVGCCACCTLREVPRIKCLFKGCQKFLLPGLSYFRKCVDGHFTCIVCRGSFMVSHEFCVFLYNL